MIAGLRRHRAPAIARFRRAMAKRSYEGVNMFLAQLANAGVRKCRCEPAKLDFAIVGILGGELRAFAVLAAGARRVGADKLLDRLVNVLPLHAGDCGQVAVHSLAQSAPTQLAGSLAIL